MRIHGGWPISAAALALLLLTGCPSAPSTSRTDTEEGAATGKPEEPTGPVKLGNLIEPFDVPPLEELEANVKWIDQPVVSAMERYREWVTAEPPLVSVEQALKLRNNSPENNEKIISALGRPPESESAVNWDAELNRMIPMELKSTNPLLVSSTAEFDVTGMTGFGLFGFDWELTPFALAEYVESWQTSEDRMYDKVVLRDDMTWSDGKPITAHDVEFSFKAIMTEQVPAVAVRSGTDELKMVKAYDDRTLVYFHEQPAATNVWNVNFAVIPKHVYESSILEDPSLGRTQYHINYENAPVAGGPYKFKSRTRQQEIVLERREDWFMHDGKQVREKPYFKTIRFRILTDQNVALLALRDGKIDELEITRPDQWVTGTDDAEFYRRNTKAYGTEWAFGYIGWNCTSPFFEDKRVRKAMSYALNHKEMIETICYGLFEPGQGIYHPDSWMFPEGEIEPYQQDLDKAEDLLDEAGWVDSDYDGIRDKEIGGRIVPFEFTVIVAVGSDTNTEIAQLLKENLSQIGVICNITPTEFTVMQEKAREHKFQAMIAGWGTGADPDTGENLWTTKAIESNGRNYSHYSNPKVDELFEKGKVTFDRDERAKIYGEIAKILWEDQPYTWLYYRSGFYGFNKALRGYRFSPRGPYGYSPGLSALWKPAAQAR